MEYRKNRLFERGRSVNFSVPHLVVDAVEDSVDRNRGVADAYAARLLYSDQALHQSLQPDSAIAKITFDILEQLRCETLAAGRWAGIRANLDTAFNHWCRHARATGLVENEIGLLIYGVTQIVRSRLSSQLQDEEVEGLIESVRFRLAPVIGHDLAQLRPLVGNRATDLADRTAELIDGAYLNQGLASGEPNSRAAAAKVMAALDDALGDAKK